jgi:hypothetical protein
MSIELDKAVINRTKTEGCLKWKGVKLGGGPVGGSAGKCSGTYMLFDIHQ